MPELLTLAPRLPAITKPKVDAKRDAAPTVEADNPAGEANGIDGERLLLTLLWHLFPFVGGGPPVLPSPARLGAALPLRLRVSRVGLVVVGWLGRDSTTLHCTHHVATRRLKRHQSDFSFCLSLQCLRRAASWSAMAHLPRREMASTLKTVDGLQEELAPLRVCPVASSVFECGHRRPLAPTSFRQCTPTL